MFAKQKVSKAMIKFQTPTPKCIGPRRMYKRAYSPNKITGKAVRQSYAQLDSISNSAPSKCREVHPKIQRVEGGGGVWFAKRSSKLALGARPPGTAPPGTCRLRVLELGWW